MMDVMFLAKALKQESVREWPVCLRQCGIIPEDKVNVSGMEEEGMSQTVQRNELNQINTHTHTVRTRQHPTNALRMADEALGADVKTPCQAMKNNVMWLGAFLRGTATKL